MKQQPTEPHSRQILQEANQSLFVRNRQAIPARKVFIHLRSELITVNNLPALSPIIRAVFFNF
jgi:hypothetical protein